MPKFIIDVLGEAEIIEAEDLAAAEDVAQQSWMDNVQQDWGAQPYTKALAVEMGLEDEGEDNAE